MIEFMLGAAAVFGVSALVLLFLMSRAQWLDDTGAVMPRGVKRANRAR